MIRTSPPLAWLKQRWKTAWALGLAVWVMASALRIIEACALDSPAGAEWMEAGVRVLEPWLERDGGKMGFTTWLRRETNAGEWIGCLGGIELNGQWDPRLGGLGAALLLAVAVFGLTRSVLRGLEGGVALGVATVMTIAWGLPGVAHEVAASWSGREGWLWCLGLGHLALTWSTPRRPWGHLCGLAAVAASSAGAWSAIALIMWTWLEGRSRSGRRPVSAGTIAWNAALVLAALARVVGQGEAAPFSVFGPAWTDLIGACLLAGPGLVMAARSLGGRGPVGRDRGVLGVVTFWLLLLAVGGGGRPPLGTAVGVAFAFAVQAAAWAHLRSMEAGGRGRVTLFASMWGVAMLPLLIAANRDLPSPSEITQEAQVRAAGVRVHMATGDITVLADALHLAEDDAGRVANWLRNPGLKPWLPSSVRAPLDVWSDEATDEVFAARHVPSLPGLPAGYAAVASTPGATGERQSAVFETGFPLLQVYVAGVGEPGRTEVGARTESGGQVQPLQTRYDATGVWRRINLPAPRGPASLVVRDFSSQHWFAVSSPVELGRGTWLAGKIAGAWLYLAVAGAGLMVVAALAALYEVWRNWCGADASQPASPPSWVPYVALAAYGVVLSGFLDTHAAGADAAGYLAQARMLRDGELTVPMRAVPGVSVSPGIYTPLGFVPRPDGHLAPGYPSGLPLMIAAFATVLPFAWATGGVIALHAIGGVAVVRLLARACGLPGGWAWLAAFWVGLSPVYLFMGLQPMSDVPALVWLSAAFLFALRSVQGSRWALACGMATAMAVLLRPANAIAFLPLVVALGSWRAVALWIAGAMPGAAWFFWHAWMLYGSPLSTGYGDMSGAFGWEWVWPSLRQYGMQLAVNFTPVIALAFVAPFIGCARRRVRGTLVVWVAVFLTFYAGYYFTHLAWWYQRFLLPAYPALAILALLVVRAWVERRNQERVTPGARPASWMTIVVLGACLLIPAAVQGRRLLVLHPSDGNSRYTDLAQWAEKTLPADAAIFAFEASTALFHHTPFTILRFDQGERAENARVAGRLLELGRPVYAIVFHLAEQEEINARLPAGEWREVHRLAHMEVRRLVALGPVPDAGGAKD